MRNEALGAQDRVSACKLAGQTLLCLKGHMDEVRLPEVEVTINTLYTDCPLLTVP